MLAHLGKADEARTAQKARPRVNPGTPTTSSRPAGLGSTRASVAVARLEHPQPAVVPPRRVRHREPGGDRLSQRDVEHDPAGLALTPAVPAVGPAQGGHVLGPPVDHGEAVEVAAVLRGERGNERRPPTRHEAVVGRRSGKAREARVDRPELVTGAREFVHADVASTWHRARAGSRRRAWRADRAW